MSPSVPFIKIVIFFSRLVFFLHFLHLKAQYMILRACYIFRTHSLRSKMCVGLDGGYFARSRYTNSRTKQSSLLPFFTCIVLLVFRRHHCHSVCGDGCFFPLLLLLFLANRSCAFMFSCSFHIFFFSLLFWIFSKFNSSIARNEKAENCIMQFISQNAMKISTNHSNSL